MVNNCINFLRLTGYPRRINGASNIFFVWVADSRALSTGVVRHMALSSMISAAEERSRGPHGRRCHQTRHMSRDDRHEWTWWPSRTNVMTVTNERDDRHERTWRPSRANVMTVTNKRDDHHETKISHKPWLYFTHRHKLNRIYRPPCCRAQWPSTANYGAIRRILQSPELKKGLVKNSLIPWILDK